MGALAADCAPVLFADAEARVVAAAHAGWRGAVAGIIESTLTAMESIGAERRRIRAAIGPCIGQRSYEVGTEFEAELLSLDPANERHFSRFPLREKPHFDLAGYVASRLAQAGITAVDVADVCTYESESLFSYRRAQHRSEGDYGRQISAIVVT